MRTASLLVVLVLAGCGRTEGLVARARSAGDAGRPLDGAVEGSDACGRDSGGSDAGRSDAGRSDAGRSDAGTSGPDASRCTQPEAWRLEPRTLGSAALVDTDRGLLGAAERLEVELVLPSGCERLARVTVSLSPGGATDFVALAGWAWVQQAGACDPAPSRVRTRVLLPGRGQGNQRVVVTDGHGPEGALLLSYERDGCSGADCDCYPGVPPGTVAEFSECRTDCACLEGLACLPGPAGAPRRCLRPCQGVQDCAAGGGSCAAATPGGASFVCRPGDACAAPSDCPEGFSCALTGRPTLCLDERSVPALAPCACDAQCPAGQRCTQTDRPAPTCEIPCASTADCPTPYLVCGTQAVCVPLEG